MSFWTGAINEPSASDVARFCRVDVSLDVVGQEQPAPLELLGRLRHRANVSLVVAVALLERHARISRGEPLRLRGRERNELPGRFAPVESVRPPARRRSDELDDCTDDSVPVQGGGCQKIGIPADGCAEGFAHDGQEIELSVVDGDRTVTVDGERHWGSIPELEQPLGSYTVHARRLEGELWEVRVSRL